MGSPLRHLATRPAPLAAHQPQGVGGGAQAAEAKAMSHWDTNLMSPKVAIGCLVAFWIAVILFALWMAYG